MKESDTTHDVSVLRFSYRFPAMAWLALADFTLTASFGNFTWAGSLGLKEKDSDKSGKVIDIGRSFDT